MVGSGVAAMVVGTVLPPACPVCGAVGSAPCGACWAQLRPAAPGPVPAGLDRCRSLLSYEGVGRELLARLKYRNARSSLAWLASGMASLAARMVVDLDVRHVTWAPTSGVRRRARGYDQAELLARRVAADLGLACGRRLRRLPGPPQTGRGRDERLLGPAFVGRGPPVEGAVLLVDDLLTTGATLTAAARALRVAGATTVVAVTAGRTPRHAVPAPPGRASRAQGHGA